MIKRALAASGLAIPLIGLAVALAPAANAAPCISTVTCMTHNDPGMTHNSTDPGMTHDGILSTR